jgi:uncharacterized phiE125 gp8 family phage protein
MTPSAFPPAAIAGVREAVATLLRLSGGEEGEFLDACAGAALGICEAFTATAWIAREWQEMLPASDRWQRLAMAPVTAITLVEGVPAEGASFALPSENYAIDIDAAGVGWVRTIVPGAAGRVRVSYGAGAVTEWGDLPPPMMHGVALMAAHLFENRHAGDAPPAAVASLWRPYRRVRL